MVTPKKPAKTAKPAKKNSGKTAGAKGTMKRAPKPRKPGPGQTST